MGEVALLHRNFHTEVGLEQMAYAIVALGEDTRVIMEATGRYHEPIAAACTSTAFMSASSIRYSSSRAERSIRKVKTTRQTP